MKAGAADVAALGRFATSATLQPSLDESALKLCGRTHDLAKESPLRIVRIIPYDLGTLGGLEDTDVIPGSPGARESDLLDVKLACQPVWSMHDQALGEAVVKSNKRGREAGAVLDPERTAQSVVAKHDHDLVSVGSSPISAGLLLSLKRVRASAVLRARSAISDELDISIILALDI